MLDPAIVAAAINKARFLIVNSLMSTIIWFYFSQLEQGV
jgi:hypothetical protein